MVRVFFPVRRSQKRMLSSWLAESQGLSVRAEGHGDDGIGVSGQGVRRFLLLPLAGRRRGGD